jgi:hypothetical protein
MLSLCSWSRSFLWPVPAGRGRAPSARRVVRAFLAARRRWPAGRLSLRLGQLCWSVPAGRCPPGSDLVGRSLSWPVPAWVDAARPSALRGRLGWASYAHDARVIGAEPSLRGWFRCLISWGGYCGG